MLEAIANCVVRSLTMAYLSKNWCKTTNQFAPLIYAKYANPRVDRLPQMNSCLKSCILRYDYLDCLTKLHSIAPQ